MGSVGVKYAAWLAAPPASPWEVVRFNITKHSAIVSHQQEQQCHFSVSSLYGFLLFSPETDPNPEDPNAAKLCCESWSFLSYNTLGCVVASGDLAEPQSHLQNVNTQRQNAFTREVVSGSRTSRLPEPAPTPCDELNSQTHPISSQPRVPPMRPKLCCVFSFLLEEKYFSSDCQEGAISRMLRLPPDIPP